MLAALHTGFRKSELLSLTWDDVDFRRGVITVRAAYAKNGEGRSVPMNKLLTETLKAIRMSASSAQHVFCNYDGVPYRSFRSAFDRAVQKAGLTNLTFHDLRHVFASRLIMHGVDLPTVKELLGHKVMAMTFTHLSSDHQRQAVRTLEQSAKKVPAIFTTRHASQGDSLSQPIEIASVPR